MERSANRPGISGISVVFAIGLGALLATWLPLVCLAPSAQATKYPASTLDLYVDDRAAFNLAVPGENEGLFEDGAGPGISPGQAGLAMFVDQLGTSVGVSQPTGFQPLSGPEVIFEDASARMVETRVQVMAGEFPLFEVTQSILQSKEDRSAGVFYTVENVSDNPLSFRPYLLGNLRLDAANTASSTYSTSPLANLTVASTTTPRVMDVFVPLDEIPSSAKVGAWADVGLATPAANLPYGQFVPSTTTNPAFGIEWSVWQDFALAPFDSAVLASSFIVSSQTPPEPVPGKTAVVEPVDGTVLVKTPGGTYEELEAGQEIPIGSLIDVRKGTIRLTSAGAGGKDQTARFRYGIFRVLQKRSSPLTTLKLAGPLVGCGRSASGAEAGAGLRASSLRGRKVWGSGKGKFKTSGKRGSGSVRGTTWQVTDNCNGSTRIQSISGTVVAQDFGKPRFKRVLRSGQSYLARARR